MARPVAALRCRLTRYTPGLIAVLLAACNAHTGGQDNAQDRPPMTPAIVPAPVSLETLGGHLPWPAAAAVASDEPDFAFWRERLADAFRRDAAGSEAAVQVRLLRDPALAAEAYRLRIDDDIELAAATPAGMGHAVHTLLQLLAANAEASGLPRLVIEDAPAFGWRGMHLDVSRHFFDVAFVKKYIDLLALHKMNVLHWHLTDDQGWRIAIDAYPRLTSVGALRSGTVVGHTHDANAASDGVPHGGYYSQAEVRDVVAYAGRRGVTIVPEIDVPGHASAILAAYPEFGCGPATDVQTHFGIFRQILCPTDKTFAFLDTVLGEVAALFPGPYIHIGGDEVLTDHWEQCAACRDLMARESIGDTRALQDYFFERAAALVRKHGKTPIGWDEILNDAGEAAGTVMAWRGVERGIEAAKHGHDVIMTPVSNTYFDFYQSTSLDEPMSIHGLTRLKAVYAFQPVPPELGDDVRGHVLGGQGALWTEYVPTAEDAERQVLPRMSALAEVLWSPDAARDFPGFLRRLETFVPYLESRGYTVSTARFKPEIRAQRNPGGFRIEMDAEVGIVHYTLDGSTPDADSPVYEEAFTSPGSAAIRARTLTAAGDWYGDARLSVEAHAGQEAMLTGDGLDANQTGWAANVLLDGLLASNRIFHYDDWFGLEGRDLDLVLEWPAARSVGQVSLGVDAGRHRELVRPKSARVLVDYGDGHWTGVAALDDEAIQSGGPRLEFSFAPVRVRRLRVVLGNPGPAWSAEHAAEAPTTLRVDELVVH